jgi:hypothetical protein
VRLRPSLPSPASLSAVGYLHRTDQVWCRGSRTTSDVLRRARSPQAPPSLPTPQGPAGVVQAQDWRECPMGAVAVEAPRATPGHAGPRTARSARAVPGAGRVSSRKICRPVGRSMPAVSGARACSPARQLNSRPAALGGEPAGYESVQSARRRRRAPCRMNVCGLLSCNGVAGRF